MSPFEHGNHPSVQVLLSSFNGERYLRDQLDSLLSQTFTNVKILVRDDGSSDGTRALLEEYRDRSALRWYAGDNLGSAMSFWRLVNDADDEDYFAFCDQDDVWDIDKLEIAVNALETLAGQGPKLYCSDVRVTDEQMRVMAERMARPMPLDYRHALIRNIAPGCTFVFNNKARNLLCRYDAATLGIDLHDWTVFRIVSCFGKVLFDEKCHMNYRQHGDNAIGAPSENFGTLLDKAHAFWNGPKRNSRETGARRMELAFATYMSEDNRQITADYAHYREDRSRKHRLLRSSQPGLSMTEQAFFKILVACNRL